MSKRANRKEAKRRVRRQINRDLSDSAAKQDTMRATRRGYGQGNAR
jgi:hypothetical protein